MTRKALFPLLALGAGAAFATVALAFGPDGPTLTSVPTANLKSPGYAPASRLSPELRQVVVAQGATALENPQGIVTNYGYENDVPSTRPGRAADAADTGLGERGAEDRTGQEHLPGLQEGPARSRPAYNYGSHFLYQGHELGATVNGRPRATSRASTSMPTAHTASRSSPGRTRPANRSQPIDGSTWDPFARPAALHDREPERADLRGDTRLPVHRRRRLGRARARRLRGHPGRRRGEHLDRRGHRRRRTRAARREAAEQLRLPLRPEAAGRPRRTASCRCCRC